MKPRIVSKTFGWVIVVLIIMGIFVYFFSNSNSKVIVDPNIITITEGTQGFKDSIRISVANIRNGSGVIYLTSQAKNINKNVNTGIVLIFRIITFRLLRLRKTLKFCPRALQVVVMGRLL